MNKVNVNYKGKNIELNVLHGTEGPDCVDISPFEKELSLFTFDPAFVSTASCESKITFIDGDKGVLAHRGHLIEDLTGNTTLLELFFLLMTGKKKEKTLQILNHSKKLPSTILKLKILQLKLLHLLRKLTTQWEF